jgi:hypothetical protein
MVRQRRYRQALHRPDGLTLTPTIPTTLSDAHRRAWGKVKPVKYWEIDLPVFHWRPASRGRQRLRAKLAPVSTGRVPSMLWPPAGTGVGTRGRRKRPALWGGANASDSQRTACFASSRTVGHRFRRFIVNKYQQRLSPSLGPLIL